VAELNSTELFALGKKAVDFAIRNGAEEAEAFLSTLSNTSINIERGQIVRSTKRVDQGLGVRAIYKKAMGFSYTNTLTFKNIENAATEAFKSARASRPDSNWQNLPSPKSFGETKGTYDKSLETISSDELVEMAVVMLEAVEACDSRVLPVDGGVGTSLTHTVVVNSQGVEAYDRGSAIGCSMETIARDGADVTPACFELDAARAHSIDPEWVGREAARQAVSSLKAEKLASGSFPVIFTQDAFRSLLSYTLINAVKADYVQRERSALKGKVGEEIASDLVTVYDDGLLEGGLLTGKFDGEGVPCQKTLVIERGVLRQFLYDNYTANKAGVESTSNASRGGFVPYASTPVLEASNFVVSEGNKSAEDLVGEVEDGLIVYGVQGAHSSNVESGEFSVVATPVWKIEGGSVVYPVRGVMLAGVVFDVLKNVSALGNNVRKIGQLVAPWVRVEDVKVVGRR
jgi:PmbA protein